mmetsp:Transcript_8449/g.20031  ORF Transcript_8449/g.20031 Transcript_8449/m.20031 type:complete len:337 (-) Transcript_8449:60-1070(-)
MASRFTWPEPGLAMCSTTAMPSSSALCASIGPRTTSPMANTCGTFVCHWSSISTQPRASVRTPIVSRPRPSVNGRRPTDTSTRSARSSLGEPPAAASVRSATWPSCTSAPTTLRFSSNLMPCRLSSLCTSLATSRSLGNATWSVNSTTVTSAPRRDHTEPSSRPITPPPTTTSDSGTAPNSSAPVLDTTRCSSNLRNGSSVGALPVAITTLRARTVLSCSPLVASATATVCGSTNEPRPTSCVTPYFLNRPAMPPVRPTTVFCFSFCILATSTSTPLVLMPYFLSKSYFASWYRCDALSSALLGMQPRLRHVPPSAPLSSTHVVRRPSCAALIAAT